MSTTSALWAEDIALSFNTTIPGAGAEATADIDIASGGYIVIDLQISVTFGASPNGPALVTIRGSSDSGFIKDTEPLHQFIIPASASTTVVVSKQIRMKAFVEIGVLNQNTSESITISGKYAGMKYTIV